MKQMNRSLKPILPPTVQTKICYTSTRLSSKFNFKDKTKINHIHNIIYKAECPYPSCQSSYIGETARRIETRIKEHSGKDINSHLLKHAIETGHPTTTLKDFKIIGQNFRNKWERKIGEALYIKRLKPDLNIQEKSFSIQLLN